jgi:hypothetical protein
MVELGSAQVRFRPRGPAYALCDKCLSRKLVDPQGVPAELTGVSCVNKNWRVWSEPRSQCFAFSVMSKSDIEAC